ncbi:MAG: Hint domain-containing protein [Rhodospirillales bacterium]|nr:Hint domain-containing protein [Rhodospirillales bacterium]
MAITYTWKPVGGGQNWTTAANWSPVGIPGSLDTAVVVLTGTLLGDNQSVGTLFLSGGTLGQLSDVLTAGTAELLGGTDIVGALDATTADFVATTTIDGLVAATGAVTVGGTATGTVDIGGAGSLTAGSLLVGGNSGVVGLLQSTGIGGFAVAGGATLGASGTGDLSLVNAFGASVGANLVAGLNGGSAAALSLTLVSILNVAGNATLGAGGSVTTTIDTGSVLSITGGLTVAASAGSVGSIDVSGDSLSGGTLSVGGDATLFAGGTGTLVAENSGEFDLVGGTTLSNRVFLGGGTLIARGGGAINANAIVMSNGAALQVLSGARVNLRGADVGTLAGGPVGLVANGAVTVTGAALDTTVGVNAAQIIVGDGPSGGGTGLLSLGTTASVTDSALILGYGTGNQGVLVVASGANLSQTSGGLTIGDAGAGTLTLSGASVISDAGNAVIGALAGGTGTASLRDSGATWSVGGTLSVGGAGAGTLSLGTAATGGPNLSTGVLMVGANAGGVGRMTVANSAVVTDNAALIVGEGGAGSLELDAANVSAAAIILGDAAGSSGTLNVASASATLAATSSLVVGNSGSGTFVLGAGVSFNEGHGIDVGALAGGSGSLLVNGTLSTTGSNLRVGVAGSGQMNVAAAGSVSVNGAFAVGSAGTGSGSVTLMGGSISAASLAVGASSAILGSGSLAVAGVSNNAGQIVASGGTLRLNAALTGTGSLQIGGASVLELIQGAPTSQSIVFQASGASELLELVAPKAVSSVIKGFGSHTTIDLLGTTHTLTQSYAYNTTSHVLTVSDLGTVEASFTFDATMPNTSFQLIGDGLGTGTDIIPCFCAGTRIGTVLGPVPVEALVVGDRVVTAGGRVRPIIWIGRRSYEGRFVAANPQLQPVRICAGALGGGVPKRDLFVSPLHALLIDGVLVPAGGLVNGRSIRRLREAADLRYYHIELAEHDVLLAEGAPAESFLDLENGQMFENGHLRPAAAGGPARQSCAPRIEGGPLFDAIRARLGGAMAATGGGALRGNLERADRHGVEGWASDGSGRPAELEVLVDGFAMARTWAASYRIDLDRAGLADGACGFAVRFDPSLPTGEHDVVVRRVQDGALVPGAPRHVALAA